MNNIRYKDLKTVSKLVFDSWLSNKKPNESTVYSTIMQDPFFAREIAHYTALPVKNEAKGIFPLPEIAENMIAILIMHWKPTLPELFTPKFITELRTQMGSSRKHKPINEYVLDTYPKVNKSLHTSFINFGHILYVISTDPHIYYAAFVSPAIIKKAIENVTQAPATSKQVEAATEHIRDEALMLFLRSVDSKVVDGQPIKIDRYEDKRTEKEKKALRKWEELQTSMPKRGTFGPWKKPPEQRKSYKLPKMISKWDRLKHDDTLSGDWIGTILSKLSQEEIQKIARGDWEAQQVIEAHGFGEMPWASAQTVQKAMIKRAKNYKKLS